MNYPQSLQDIISNRIFGWRSIPYFLFTRDFMDKRDVQHNRSNGRWKQRLYQRNRPVIHTLSKDYLNLTMKYSKLNNRFHHNIY